MPTLNLLPTGRLTPSVHTLKCKHLQTHLSGKGSCGLQGGLVVTAKLTSAAASGSAPFHIMRYHFSTFPPHAGSPSTGTTREAATAKQPPVERPESGLRATLLPSSSTADFPLCTQCGNRSFDGVLSAIPELPGDATPWLSLLKWTLQEKAKMALSTWGGKLAFSRKIVVDTRSGAAVVTEGVYSTQIMAAVDSA